MLKCSATGFWFFGFFFAHFEFKGWQSGHFRKKEQLKKVLGPDNGKICDILIQDHLLACKKRILFDLIQ